MTMNHEAQLGITIAVAIAACIWAALEIANSIRLRQKLAYWKEDYGNLQEHCDIVTREYSKSSKENSKLKAEKAELAAQLEDCPTRNEKGQFVKRVKPS